MSLARSGSWGHVCAGVGLACVLLALGCEERRGEGARRARDASADRDAEQNAGRKDAAADSGEHEDATASNTDAAVDSGPDLDDAGHETDSPPDPLYYLTGGRAYGPLLSKQGVWVLLTRSSESTSKFQLDAESLPASGQYNATVHRLPCEAAEGGERYRIDPSQGYDAANILSHTFDVGDERSAVETWTVSHRVRQDAQSLVIVGPAPATARVACVNLAPKWPGQDFEGALKPFRDADDVDREITGMGSFNSAWVDLRVQGLRPEREYEAVLYAVPCQYARVPATETGLDAMDHQAYRIDPTAAALGANSVKLAIDPTGFRRAETRVRLDAQSLVLFRKPALPIACADLAYRGTYPDFITTNANGEPYSIQVLLTRSRTRTKFEARVSFVGGPQTKATIKLLGTSCTADRKPYLIDPAGSPDNTANRIEIEAFGDDRVRSLTTPHLVRVEAHAILVSLTPPNFPRRCLDLF